MTRIGAKAVVMAFVVLLTLAVFAMMALTPADSSQSGPMSGHGMSGMSGMSGHDMSGMSGMSGHDMSGMSGTSPTGR